jgi:catechol 2,3-dioxygenase-like lactoylglutathione lyase family enzyme
MNETVVNDAELSSKPKLEVPAKDGRDSMVKRGCQNTGIHHVGLHAKDPAASAAFYCDILGMQLTGGSGPEHPLGATAFLCSRPDEEAHEIALFADPKLVHVAFKVSSLAEFRSLHARVIERNIPVKFAFNFGISFAFFFDDPDGNMIEVYWPTGLLDSYPQPYAEPLDLSKSDEVLLEQVTRGPAQMGFSAATRSLIPN